MEGQLRGISGDSILLLWETSGSWYLISGHQSVLARSRLSHKVAAVAFFVVLLISELPLHLIARPFPAFVIAKIRSCPGNGNWLVGLVWLWGQIFC